ncbi:MAG TPA: SEC-C metal-binding domain-containing protein, partial [Candidatus Saccharimonadales bacterium]|nr:SEC-C metal-binding domain-containing protein [Candidatus Saccharimonadales bacterium]
PVKRSDYNDVIYKSESAKFKAVADEIAEKHEKGQPVLVGTTSVDKSQLLHEFLRRKQIPHEILNAKNHEQEALIIAQAGRKGAVTVSTNMAGRGVDIILGGDPIDPIEHEEVKQAGGLHVIGTERHESRRIDNQLRGRSGRQGDPGSSKFFVSLQDELMRVFGGAQIEGLMNRFGLDENTPIEAGLVSKAIENAQKKVEGFNFDRRKQLVEMDDVMNTHREVVYKLRRRILELGEDHDEFKEWLISKFVEHANYDSQSWDKHEKDFGKEIWYQAVAQLSLPVIDLLWMEHLVDMDDLREGIGLRGYAQRDPMVEYKREGHERFGILVAKIYSTIADRLSRIQSSSEVGEEHSVMQSQNLSYQSSQLETGVREEAGMMQSNDGRQFKVEAVKPNDSKVGRNDLCPCGSGKKYKNCGLLNTAEHQKLMAK